MDSLVVIKTLKYEGRDWRKTLLGCKKIVKLMTKRNNK